MNCNCINNIDAELKERNMRLTGYVARLMPSFHFAPAIKTDWINPARAPKGQKNKCPQLIGSFCPFCGASVEPKPGAQLAAKLNAKEGA